MLQGRNLPLGKQNIFSDLTPPFFSDSYLIPKDYIYIFNIDIYLKDIHLFHSTYPFLRVAGNLTSFLLGRLIIRRTLMRVLIGNGTRLSNKTANGLLW